MAKQIPELTSIPTPVAGNETDIETVVAKQSTFATYKMTLAQIFTLGALSGGIKNALDALSSLISANTSSISGLSTTKLDKAGALRTGLTAKRVLVVDASGNETYVSGTSPQQVGFDGSGNPVAVTPTVDINGLTQKTTPIGNDEVIISDSEASFVNKKIKLSSWLSPFGNGSDGDVIISSNTTLVRDMFYRNLTINGTFVLNPNGYKIFVSETFTNNGIVRRNGNTGGNGSNTGGGPGGTAGAILNQGSLNAEVAGGDGGYASGSGAHPGVAGTSSSLSYTNINGVAGGVSTDSLGNTSAGGVGGTSTRGAFYNVAYNSVQAICALTNPASFSLSTTQYKGPSGSGGGGTDWTPNAGYTGGGAGGNGGVIFICAKTINNTSGLIESKGGNGGAGWGPGGVNGGGGGGGGQGGVVILIYVTLTSIGTITLTGGAGGARGGTNAGDGLTGNTGVTIQIPITI